MKQAALFFFCLLAIGLFAVAGRAGLNRDKSRPASPPTVERTAQAAAGEAAPAAESATDREWNLFGESLTNLHRASAHFPIGLLMSSAFFDLLGLALRRDDLKAAGFWTHLLGVLAAAATVTLGLIGNPY